MNYRATWMDQQTTFSLTPDEEGAWQPNAVHPAVVKAKEWADGVAAALPREQRPHSMAIVIEKQDWFSFNAFAHQLPELPAEPSAEPAALPPAT